MMLTQKRICIINITFKKLKFYHVMDNATFTQIACGI